ncbi:hypothetical protein [Candidatus Marithrix sp. Canyon 246]|uniref:hypothetical protein n=1 Tax=Candidatus Marithrix sp. Canyon 246 TaxID=1827136 RepID=UPI00114D0CF9|nr:hypothetical protein [Candidatus Marithrix sp. Canyon 246]
MSILNKKSQFLLILIAVSFVSVELFARFVLGLGDPAISIEHSSIEYMFKPNQDVKRFGNRILINQYGMRSNHFDKIKKQASELRVMVYGDSVINGGNLTDHSQLATSLLQQELSKQIEIPVIVGNISAGSWGPINILAHSKEFGFFNADIVILVLSSHDYADIPTFLPLNPNTHPTNKPIFAVWEGITRYLPKYLPLIYNNETHPVQASLTKQTAIDSSLQALRKMILNAKTTEAKVMLLLHWTKQELESGLPNEGHGAIRGILSNLQIPIYQDSQLFQKNINKGQNPYRDNIHPNVLGQQILSSIMMKMIQNVRNE